MATAALWWEWQVRLGREAGASLGPQLYQEVRYEALVGDTAGELEPLCAFLDISFDRAMLDYHQGRQRSDRGLSAKSAWLPPTPGLRDWKTQMGPEDAERFEAVAGDLLDELGYPRDVPEPRRRPASSRPSSATGSPLRFARVAGGCRSAGSASRREHRSVPRVPRHSAPPTCSAVCRGF